jgi:hypothetical protein
MMNRIPTLGEITAISARNWMDQMIESGLFFHPDDDPADIAFAPDWKDTFGEVEVVVLRDVVSRLFATLGDQVYEIGCDALGITGRAGSA